jgi:hypothetical protein
MGDVAHGHPFFGKTDHGALLVSELVIRAYRDSTCAEKRKLEAMR